jgi:tRNA wybutosine-synthesizing protein 1
MRRFCYCRHHSNPVGTEWKWKMDDAQSILDGALANHIGLIRQFKGNGITVMLPH